MPRSLFRRLLGCRRGATALEFAIVGPVMLTLIFAIVEDGLMLFAQSVLDNATRDASRQIMIGNITTASGFQTQLCSDVTSFFDCTKLQFNVQSSAGGFPAVIVTSSLASVLSTANFSSGSGGQYVFVEVAYNRPYMFPWIQKFAGAGWALMSIQAFQNEPFS
nr:TadE/TadG family type IV pilus assembly protein [uncultured Lichenicoccus sp.]